MFNLFLRSYISTLTKKIEINNAEYERMWLRDTYAETSMGWYFCASFKAWKSIFMDAISSVI